MGSPGGHRHGLDGNRSTLRAGQGAERADDANGADSTGSEQGRSVAAGRELRFRALQGTPPPAPVLAGIDPNVADRAGLGSATNTAHHHCHAFRRVETVTLGEQTSEAGTTGCTDVVAGRPGQVVRSNHVGLGGDDG